MKKIYGYAALFAAMSLASCSSDNEPNVVDFGELQKGYIAIDIDDSAITRAASNNATKDGENTVKDVTIVTFINGVASQFIPVTNFAAFGESTENGVEKESANIIEVQAPTEGQSFQVMTILNNPGLTAADINGKTIKDVRELTYTDFGNVTDKGLVMTTAAVVKNGANVYTTDFTGKVYQDETTAANNKVTIYVERMAARVDVAYPENGMEVNQPSNVALTDDGQEYTITIDVEGVEIANVGTKSNLVKSLEGIDDNVAISNWADGLNRTHWATTPTQQYDNMNFDGYKAAGMQNGGFYHYLHENTATQHTAVVVTANIKVNNQSDVILYRAYVNGKYYTVEGIKNALLGLLQTDGYQKADHSDLLPADVKFVEGNYDYDSYIEIEGNAADVMYKNGEATTVGAVNAALKEAGNRYRVMQYTDNKCYYFANLEGEKGKPGVVRNHVYSLSLDKLGGIGIPQYNPNKPIIPTDPEDPTPDGNDKWYLNTTIKILDWTVYSQPVDFTR